MILDYSGGLLSTQSPSKQKREAGGRSDVGPGAKEGNASRRPRNVLPQSLQKEHRPPPRFRLLGSVRHAVVLFQAARLVVISHSSCRKWTHP